MKKKIGIALSFMMSVSLINTDLNIVNAENDNQEISEYSNSIIDSGKCGDNATWQLTNDGTLIISGSGDMYFYEYGAMPWDNYNFQISTVNICTGITGISSFSSLRNLKIINISDTVSEIGDKYSLQIRCASTITVDRDNKFYSSKEGILYDKAQEKLLKCPFEKENVTMPNTVTYIGKDAFSGCSNLKNVTLSNNLKDISSCAFDGCTNLSDIILPDSLVSIGASAFQECVNLKSLKLSKNVKNIDFATFYKCNNLERIDVDKNNKYFTAIDGVLYNKSQTKLIKCPDAKENVNISTTVTEITDEAFNNCYKLEKIIIPNGVKKIGMGAFASCSKLKTLNLPDSVEDIGEVAFESCNSLEKIILPKNLKGIGYRMLEGLPSLIEVQIPSTITFISESAFYGCTSLRNITIPNSVTSIDDYAFAGCSDLTLSVYKGSYGEKYAKENNRKYKIIDQTIVPTSVKLNAISKTIQKGKTYTLVATIAPSNATNKTVTYSSNNKKVATVTSTGTIKAINYGTAVITAKTSNGKTTTCKVNVPYTVKYNLNGGTNNKVNPTSYYGKKITLQNPTRKGYSFAGWHSDSKYKTKVTSFSSGNKVLYAKWNKVTMSKAKTPTLTNIATRKLKVSYGGISGVKGYQIQYATNSKFTGSKTKTTSSRSNTITSLTKGKRYYVRVRGYKTDSTGNKVYGSWSTVKNIKISK